MTQCIMTKGLCSVTPQASHCPVSLLSPPGPVTARCPVTPPGLWCPSCHPPGLHHPASPPVSPWVCGGSPNSPGPIIARCPVTPQAVTTRCPLLSPPSLSPPAVPSSQQPARARQPRGDAVGFAGCHASACTTGPAKGGDISACLSVSWCIYGKVKEANDQLSLLP